ncbi:aromatic ring-hydroxylating oxygenase subunit alpha [Sediminicoccus rosea]|jgi:phenylpropionate dioxygenase-like ring-hydroxylating dioxygenase large terminal subunit|uniref:Rieske 2Fe-2S domain-containing protein n=1 Tax=Sediminicoccus rosea TaxID=1225128 RepID=A0ABZ0PIC6_9PROT|nr:Rieske 2Fe-2S domain-containing protein [Sediminicoccus rosea]WPB85470.1 Rieske 2Fe-2S domain-containing protein [Sediminicoccus rosea]
MAGHDLNLAALHDPQAFAEEQARLGRVWTLLGFTTDLPRQNDWFRAVLGGRSVFIQRFAEGLRGFENRCAHRSFPLRTTERGNGPVLCGFHHWRYDSEGRAAGIPNCQDAFGTTPRELDRRLAPLDVACCGQLIFARFPGATETLEEFLGPLFEVLALLCADLGQQRRATLSARMNWRISQWISIDDYHLAAVHPKSLPTGRRYLRRTELGYHRIGRHSAYFHRQDAGDVADWLDELRGKRPVRTGYRVVHLFPNAAITYLPRLFVLPRVALPFPYLLIQRHVPVAADRTHLEATTAAVAGLPRHASWLMRLIAPFEWARLPFVQRRMLRVLREDQAVCEAMQTGAAQIAPDPLYGAAEARIAWFDEAYAAAMRPEASPG